MKDQDISKSTNVETPIQDITNIKTAKLDTVEGFICDVETGICLPVTQEEEEKK